MVLPSTITARLDWPALGCLLRTSLSGVWTFPPEGISSLLDPHGPLLHPPSPPSYSPYPLLPPYFVISPFFILPPYPSFLPACSWVAFLSVCFFFFLLPFFFTFLLPPAPRPLLLSSNPLAFLPPFHLSSFFISIFDFSLSITPLPHLNLPSPLSPFCFTFFPLSSSFLPISFPLPFFLLLFLSLLLPFLRCLSCATKLRITTMKHEHLFFYLSLASASSCSIYPLFLSISLIQSLYQFPSPNRIWWYRNLIMYKNVQT